MKAEGRKLTGQARSLPVTCPAAARFPADVQQLS